MQKNVLNRGLEISELGLGCMSLGTEKKHAQAIIERAIELGITYFDTADMYDKGINEKLVGEILKPYQNSEDIVIGTKVGNHLQPDGTTFWDPSKKHIKESVKQSLKNLGVDQIDLYQLHGGTIEDPLDETISAFDELKQEGLIRAYGISSIRPNVIKYYLEHSQIDTWMAQYNLIDNRPEDLIQQAHQKGVKMLARGPLFKGLLTAESNTALDQKFADGIFDYSYQELGSTVASLKEIENNLSALTFNYLLTQDVLGSIVAGASSVEQLEENVKNYQTHVDLTRLHAAKERVKDLHYTNHLN